MYCLGSLGCQPCEHCTVDATSDRKYGSCSEIGERLRVPADQLAALEDCILANISSFEVDAPNGAQHLVVSSDRCLQCATTSCRTSHRRSSTVLCRRPTPLHPECPDVASAASCNSVATLSQLLMPICVVRECSDRADDPQRERAREGSTRGLRRTASTTGIRRSLRK